jgi:hypothetical protein
VEAAAFGFQRMQVISLNAWNLHPQESPVFKHTPGAWQIDMETNPEEPCVRVPAYHNSVRYGHYEIANRVGGRVKLSKLDDVPDDYSEVHANAKLI